MAAPQKAAATKFPRSGAFNAEYQGSLRCKMANARNNVKAMAANMDGSRPHVRKAVSLAWSSSSKVRVGRLRSVNEWEPTSKTNQAKNGPQYPHPSGFIHRPNTSSAISFIKISTAHSTG